MRFKQHFSGSKANMYEITANNGKRLLLECGVKWSVMMESLSYDLSNIEACLLSHEHKDHSKAVKDVIRAGINVYASWSTFDVLGLGNERRAMPLEGDRSIVVIADFWIRSFKINWENKPPFHDAVDPLGFIVECDGEYLFFATDAACVVSRFPYPFSIIAIECSYNGEYLAKRVQEKTINETLATRLLNSHFEEKDAMRYIDEFCDISKCREIHLLHMSADNINKERIKKEFEKAFFIETRIVESEHIPSKTNN